MLTLPHLAEDDYRKPLLTFTVPATVLSVQNDMPRSFGFFWVSTEFWLEVLCLVLLSSIFVMMTGFIVYKVIVGPRKHDTSTAFCLGYGILLPFWVAWPFLINPIIGTRNLFIKFIVGGVLSTLVQFRLLEAIYGCSPSHATESVKEFVTYFSSVLIFSRDAKTGKYIKSSTTIQIYHFQKFFVLLLVSGALQSFLTPYSDMNVFGPPIPADGWHSLQRLLTWHLYANSLLHAFLFQLYLSTYCEGLILFWNIVTGYQTDEVMKNPLIGASSPTDFWGRRWNLLVHSALKGGIYKPMRKKGASPQLSAIATFLASGLFHEWLIGGIHWSSCNDPDSETCYQPAHGGAMVFFSWQAVLIIGEFTIGKTALARRLSAALPLSLRTLIIVAIGIPLAHFFTEPYVRSNFFRHGQMGFPMILPLDQ